MIRINEALKDPTCDLWKGEKDYIGTIKNAIQFHDIRLQIMREKASGYIIYFKGQRIKIDSNGELEEWPKGLYDQCADIIMDILFPDRPNIEDDNRTKK